MAADIDDNMAYAVLPPILCDNVQHKANSGGGSVIQDSYKIDHQQGSGKKPETLKAEEPSGS